MAIEQRLRELDARHRDLDLIIKNEAKAAVGHHTARRDEEARNSSSKKKSKSIRQGLDHHYTRRVRSDAKSSTLRRARLSG